MPTKRAQDILPFIVMDVMAAAEQMEQQGEHIIHMEVGEPDFATPECITEAAIKALKDKKTSYTHSLGLLSLREAICEYYYNEYQVSISPEQILVSSGTSPALLVLFMALLNQDDEIIMANPYYPCYPNFIKYIGGKPIFVNTYETQGFVMQLQQIQSKMSPKTRGMLINSPANPTGLVLSKENLKQFANLDIPYIISDEIYHPLNYLSKDHSILEYREDAIVINGFSKAFAMTGWRLGYVIFPKRFSRTISKLHQNFFISASRFIQEAGIVALKEANNDVQRMKQLYNTRRKFMLKRLKEIGFPIQYNPSGAFYILANASPYCTKSYDFAFDLLKKAKVAVTPGIDFGSQAEGYLRFTYANSLENLKEGFNRIEQYLRNGIS